MATPLKSAQSQKTTAFGLKGNLMTLTVMHLFRTDLDEVRQQLKSTVAATPKFFAQMPIVVDLQHLISHPYPIDFLGISNLLREYGLIPVGVSNGTAEQLQAAHLAGLGTLSQIKKEAKTEGSAKAAATKQPEAPDTRNTTRQAKTPESAAAMPSKLITTPIRSGQQVYAKGCDLIIIATVSTGAEVLADGNIHVYGTLRGRALAGVQGDQSARIFCNGLQAELISIAGQYKLQDNIDVANPNASVQIFIQDDQLQIELL